MKPDVSYEEWQASELAKLGLNKAVCPHCGNDYQALIRENWHFSHAKHEALNFQCHNSQCNRYFQIGPLSECPCGWNKEEAEAQKRIGKEWSWAHGNYGYRKVSGKMIGTHEWESYLADDQFFDDLMQLTDQEIVTAMYGKPYDANFQEIAATISSKYTPDEIAQVYLRLIDLLPDLDITSGVFDGIITDCDILWECISDNPELLEKHGIVA